MTNRSHYTTTNTSYNNADKNEYKNDHRDYFAPMDANDPLTQFFLEFTDEAVNERQRMATTGSAKRDAQNQSVAEALLEMLPSQSSASEATYEGDDESERQSSLAKTQSRSSKTQGDQENDNDDDDDNQALALTTSTRNTRTIATTTHGKKTQKKQKASLEQGPVAVYDRSSRSSSSKANKSETQVKQDALDFVHVHLEHLSTHDNQNDNDDEDNEDVEVMGHRPLSRKGSRSMQDPPNQTAKRTGKQSKTNKGTASRSASPASGYHMVSDQDGTIGNSFSYYRKFASEGSSSLPNSSSNKEAPVMTTGSPLKQQQKQKRVNPLVASLQHALSFGSTNNHTQASSIGDSEMATCRKRSKNHMNNLDNSTMMTRKQFLSLSPSEEANTSKGKGKDKAKVNSDSVEDTAFDFVNLNVTTPVVTIDSSTSVATDQHPTNSQSSAATDHHNNRENKTFDKSHGKVAFNDCEDNLQSSNDKNDWNSRRHCAADKDQSYNTSDTDISEDDDRHTDRRTNKYQRKHPTGEYRRTLLQTLQHNTRANFCAVFLLGVALATLILLIVAKLSNSHERLIYDDEEDQHIVVTNNEQLLTIEVLAFALIMVLLIGSMCYCGVATWDSAKNRYSRHQRDALVHQVKHEDACFANSSGRRKNPTYKAPYIIDSPRTISQSQLQPPGAEICGSNDEKENTGETCDRTTTPGLENQTFSMRSSTTEQTHDDNDEDDVLISMEEADQYDQELEEQARCCSPLSIISSNSTIEPYGEDEDDNEDEESRSHHLGGGGNKKKGFFS